MCIPTTKCGFKPTKNCGFNRGNVGIFAPKNGGF
jgi:hypothetical protein